MQMDNDQIFSEVKTSNKTFEPENSIAKVTKSKNTLQTRE